MWIAAETSQSRRGKDFVMDLIWISIPVLVGYLFLIYLLYRTMKATETIAATRDKLIGQMDHLIDLLEQQAKNNKN